MQRLAFILMSFALLVTCAAAAGTFEFAVYRKEGAVPFDVNGIPIMDLFAVATNASDPEPSPPANAIYMGKVQYNNSIFEMGWDQLAIAPDRRLFLSNNTAMQAWFVAGYAEGYATAESIDDVIAAQGYNYSADGQKWINDHVAYVRSNALQKSQLNDPFWTQVQKQLVQIEGMAAGYNALRAASGSSKRLTFDLIFQINILNEYSDIGPAASVIYGVDKKVPEQVDLGKFRRPKRTGPVTVPMSEQHCSGLVKVTDSDLLMSHVTWSGYNIFVGRQYKTYMMETAVSMSSNAILINSGGDWYQTTNKISVIETTNEFTNNNLYKLIKPQCVAEFMRVMVANFLATTAQQWTEVFKIEQSGTYCNQWMVLDYKLYTKGMSYTELPDGLFWIAEEIPGQVEAGDMTGFIRQNGYWASYNIPYFADIFEKSGFGVSQRAYGDFFSWFMTPRAQIFRRDHHKVHDLQSMQRMMHYNDWQNDPLSAIQNCVGCDPTNSPMLGISSRGDLVPKNASFGNMDPNYSQDFAFNWFGATDSKISSYDMINNGFRASFVNGPTHDQQPVFSWSVDPTNPLALLPGMIQTFDFPWAQVSPMYSMPAPVPQSTYRNITVDVYRKNTTVSFDANGVPLVSIVAGLRGSFKPSEGLIPLATAVHNESGLVTGFDQMTVSAADQSLFDTDESANVAWYAAGFAEGYASAEAIRIINVWRNYTYTAGTLKWVETHIAYMRANALTKFTPFWKQVRKQLIQLRGIADGMNTWSQNVDAASTPMTFLDIFMINFRDDNDDVIAISTAPVEVREELLKRRAEARTHRGDHCSALIKVTEDDILMAQATWAGWAIMIHKQIKTYILETTVTFSCNAGMIFSGDDWYQTSNKLGVQETTNEFKNASLYDLVKPQCVSMFMRVMIANYLATSPAEWVDLYSQEPAGTYCNQWMVFDYKRFDPTATGNSAKIKDGAFFILEEIPGLIRQAEMTWFLRENGYWASYNVPYFRDIADISGFTEFFNLYGDFFSWEKTPRANIFRRDNSKVTDVVSMRAMMRYNDWEKDPLSAIPNCTGCVPANSPICAIAARADLVPEDAVFGDIKAPYKAKISQGMWGAPDVKISSFKMINDGFSSSTSLSPSNIDLPTFNWNQYPENPLGYAPGVVQFYNFAAVSMKPALPVPQPHAVSGERYYVYRTSGDGVPAPVTSIPNITFAVTTVDSGEEGLIATIQYNKTAATVGFDQLTVTANRQLFADKHPLQPWFGAGIAEGYATYQSIKDVMASLDFVFPAAAQTFVDDQLSFLRLSASNSTLLKDPYWRQVRKQLLQMEGIAAGFNRRAEVLGDAGRISMEDVFRINLRNERIEIMSAVLPSKLRPLKPISTMLRSSAAVIASDKDVFIGQSAWNNYTVLVGRIYKTYAMETTVSMTSNALFISSGDEYYLTGNKLTAVATSYYFMNSDDLYSNIVPQTTPVFMRAMIANYLATTPKAWAETFSQLPSGTYCNQYLVFDYKQYSKGQSIASLPDGILYSVEEVPGLVVATDRSNNLRTQAFVASTGIPFSADIDMRSGILYEGLRYGYFFDYKANPRAQMIASFAGRVDSLEGFVALMRSADVAPVPNCTACLPAASPMVAVSPRGDLGLKSANNYDFQLGKYYGSFFTPKFFGSIDFKATSSDLINAQFGSLVNFGPNPSVNPIFSWADFPTATEGQASGMAQTFNFRAVTLAPLTPPPSSNDIKPERENDAARKIVIGVIVTSLISVVFIGSLAYCFLSKVERKVEDADKGGEYDPLVQ